jgi:hypothetical protein
MLPNSLQHFPADRLLFVVPASVLPSKTRLDQALPLSSPAAKLSEPLPLAHPIAALTLNSNSEI